MTDYRIPLELTRRVFAYQHMGGVMGLVRKGLIVYDSANGDYRASNRKVSRERLGSLYVGVADVHEAIDRRSDPPDVKKIFHERLESIVKQSANGVSNQAQ